MDKYSFLQDLSCLFELYLEPLQKETFLTQDEVREYLKNVLFILLWVKTLALGFFVAESMTEKANNKDVNRNDTSQCLSVWCVHHFLFLKGNCSSELTADKPSLFVWMFYKTCLKSINKDITGLCSLSVCYISLVHCFQKTTFRSMKCCTSQPDVFHRWSPCLVACQKCWISRRCFWRPLKMEYLLPQILIHWKHHLSSG